MKILLTSVGRRGYLVQYFKEAVGEKGEIHVANSTSISPAFRYADASFVTPLIYDETYIPTLKDYCIHNGIEAIVSLFDIDLLMLAKHKKEFEDIGVSVIVSDENVIETCNDKWKTYNFLCRNGLRTPTTYISKEKALQDLATGILQYPVIMKPRWGMGSISVYTAENKEELEVFYEKINQQIQKSYLKYESALTLDSNVIIQEKVNGQECGMDVINDLNGTFQNCIIKRKLAMRAGETDCAETIRNEQVYKMGQNLSSCLRHIANLDVDFFDCNGKIYILEMNARFGGGYPFSHLAGVDLPRAIVKWLQKEPVPYEWLCAETGVLAHKDIQIVSLGGK